MVKTESSQQIYKYSKLDKTKNMIRFLIIVLTFGIFLSCYLFLKSEPIANSNYLYRHDSIDLKLWYESMTIKGDGSKNIYSNGYLRDIVTVIIMITFLITVVYFLDIPPKGKDPVVNSTYEKIKPYIFIFKIVTVFTLVFLTASILPGFYYVNKIYLKKKANPQIHDFFTDGIKLTRDSGLAIIILSFSLGFIALGSLIYFRKSDL